MSTLDDLYSELTLPTTAKLVLIVVDGLGDLAVGEDGYLTPLEAASTPNLDDLTQDSAQGRIHAVAPGITPGGGTGHLALLGYDPLQFHLGRGVKEAFAAGMTLQPGDVAAQASFCTLDTDGLVTDRRAGRIDTARCQQLCDLIASQVSQIDNVEIRMRATGGRRFVLVLRGPDLGGPLTDSDPHCERRPIAKTLPVAGHSAESERTAAILAKFYERVLPVLAGEEPANGVLLRGIAPQPEVPSMGDRYQLRSVCLASDPLSHGLARMVGMETEGGLKSESDLFERYLDVYEDYDYFFIHCQYPNRYGRDGNFEAKKKAIEDLDELIPTLLRKRPDVLAVTGNHSTPCSVQGPSWHPQPVLLNSPFSGSDKLDRFTETSANLGSLGLFEAKYLMRLMQANARMFKKFGA